MSVEYPIAIVTVDGDAAAGAEMWKTLSAGRLPGMHLRSLADVTGQFGALVDQLAPRTEVPGPAWLLQARRNAEARTHLLREVGALSAEEVADLAGTKATNRRATASRWIKDGHIFAVTHRGDRLYLGFQFDPETHKPKPVVGQVLRALPEQLVQGGWQLALWWATPTAWLDWRRPVDLLDDDPDAVVAAAHRERAEWVAAGSEIGAGHSTSVG
jgi:hypothetical protein